jgi:hypothetical protein
MEKKSGEPERRESPGKQRPRPELTLRAAVRGVRLFLWEQAAGAPLPGSERVWQESAGAESQVRKGLSITGTEQSFEGRIPRALGAERGSQGRKLAETAERVAKPCERHF